MIKLDNGKMLLLETHAFQIEKKSDVDFRFEKSLKLKSFLNSGNKFWAIGILSKLTVAIVDDNMFEYMIFSQEMAKKCFNLMESNAIATMKLYKKFANDEIKQKICK